MVSDKNSFFMFFPYIIAYVKHVTPGMGHFWNQGHKLNKLGRGPLGDTTYQISRLYGLWFQISRFFHVLYISLCKTCDPRDVAMFGPKGII